MADWDPVDTGAGWTPVAEAKQPLTFGNTILGEGQILGSGILNIPHAAESAIVDLKRRVMGENLDAPKDTFFPEVTPGQAGQDLISGVREMSNPNAPSEESMKQGAIRERFGAPNETVESVVNHAGAVGKDVMDIAQVAAPLKAGVEKAGASLAARAAAAENAPAWAKAGFRTPEAHPIAAGVAGASGDQAMIQANQKIGNTILANEVGAKPGAEITYESLAEARKPAENVYRRVAAGLPTVTDLSPKAQAIIREAGGAGARLTKGSPAAQQAIQALKQDLLSPSAKTGDRVVTELRGLRQEGYKNLASDDVSNQQLGKAQLDMARGLEQHIDDSLPPTAGTSAEQLRAARTLLAKNFAIQEALVGKNVNLQAVGRMHLADPELLTDGLKTVAEFANENPLVSKLGQRTRPQGYAEDLGHAIGGNGHSVEPENILGSVTRIFGGKAIARRILAGNEQKNLATAGAAVPPPNPMDLAPQISTQKLLPPARPPGAPEDIVNAGGGAATNSLLDELGLTSDVQAAQGRHPGMARPGQPDPHPTAGEMPIIEFREPENWLPETKANGPVPPAAAGGEGFSLADLLSGGVEQRPSPGLSLAPEGAPAPAGGIPFTRDPGQMAGELSLADELGAAAPENLRDYPAVKSQGVPEGAMMRSPGNTANMRLSDFMDLEPREHITLESPEGSAFDPLQRELNTAPAPKPKKGPPPLDLKAPEGKAGREPEQRSMFENNASGESAASLESIRRGTRDLVQIDPDGNATPVLRDVTQIDRSAPKGHIILDRKTGEIVSRGGLNQKLAEGLKARFGALMRLQRDEGAGLGDLLGQP